MIYGETGRTPLHLDAKVSSVRFWLRLMRMEAKRLPRNAYNMLVNIRNNGYRKYKYYIYASSPGITSNAKSDTDYTDLKKSGSTNILAIEVREHVNNNYQKHIKIFTDDSVLDSLDSGAGFVIPDLKVQKYF